jgi:hypothetical protein
MAGGRANRAKEIEITANAFARAAGCPTAP